MLITRQSVCTGTVRTLDLDVTAEQLESWHCGLLIHNAMPNLSAEDREFIKTGITPEEWSELFPEEEDDE